MLRSERLFDQEILRVFRHNNDRKPKAVDEAPVVEEVEALDEEVCCSSDSEPEAEKQGRLQVLIIVCVTLGLFLFISNRF